MNSDAVVEMRPAVTNSHLKHPWCPDTILVDGLHFLRIDKWDRKLNVFCTGKGLNLNPGRKSNINYKFLEDMQRLRTQACDNALVHAYHSGDDERPLKKMRKARMSDRDVAGHVVEIVCPDLHRAGHVISGLTMKALFGVKNNPLWIELSAQNLEYIRNGVLMSIEQHELGRRWRSGDDSGEPCEEADVVTPSGSASPPADDHESQCI